MVDESEVPYVPCPTCGRLVAWRPEEQWRPFCSERCKLIDLGEWFSEERRIAGEEPSGLPDDDPLGNHDG